MRWAQEQRMKFISETLAEKGWIRRADLMKKFRISVPQCSTDFRIFRELNPGRMEYDVSKRRYALKAS